MNIASKRTGTITAISFAACAIFALVLSVSQLPAHSQPAGMAATAPETPADTWIANATVYDIEASGNTLYLGGDFDYIGPNTGCGVPVNADTGQAGRFARVNGNVRCAAPDAAGGWYVGGEFTSVGGASRNRVAHIMADGSLDPAWNPDADGTVYAIAVSGSTV